MFYLIKNLLKESFRATGWAKSTAMRLLLLFIILILFTQIWATALFLVNFLGDKIFANGSISKLAKPLFYYILIDFTLRQFLQKLNLLKFKPYLCLPIKKSTLAHFSLLRSLTFYLNIAALCFAFPFIQKVGSELSLAWAVNLFIFFFITVISISLLRVFLMLQIKQAVFLRLFPILIIAIILYLELTEIFSASTYFSNFLTVLVEKQLVFILILLPIALYFTNIALIKKGFYNHINQSKNRANELTNLFNFKNLSLTNQLVVLEFKMILRAKRPKQTYMHGIINLIVFGPLLVFVNNTTYLSYSTGVFIILSSLLTINYATLFFAWESSYYPFLMSQALTFKQIVKAKFRLLYILNSPLFLMIIGLAFFNSKLALQLLATNIFYLGASSFTVILIASFNKTGIDLNQGIMLNYQGLKLGVYLNVFAHMLAPIAILSPFYLFNQLNWGFACLAILGILGFVANPLLIWPIAKHLSERKYTMLNGFKKED